MGNYIFFENQPADFDGLQKVLEKDIRIEKDSGMNRLKKTFGVVTPILVLINVIIYIASVFTRDMYGYSYLEEVLTNNLQYVLVDKQYYRVITSVFYHFSLLHLTSNMVVLIALGARVENLMGKFWYIVAYFFCGIAASICSLMSCYAGNYYDFAGVVRPVQYAD